MLQLRDPQLELFEIRPRDEAELLEEPVEAGARTLREAHRLAAPTVHRLLDHLTRLVAPNSTRPGQVVRERVGTFGGQRNSTDRGKPGSLEGLENEAAVSAGHAAYRRDDAAVAAPASIEPARSRRSPRRPRSPARAPERPRAPVRPRQRFRPARAPPASQPRRPPARAPSSQPTPARAP